MSLLVVGLSHNSAPVSVLESVAIAATELPPLLHELHGADAVAEVMVLSTCNRIEVYADVDRFHPAVSAISATLAGLADSDVAVLGEHLYVHFAEGAAEHLFQVASGLDSMVVGESQILGQLRAAYSAATEASTVGRVLHEAVQNALRVGKRVHAETGIDRAAPSVVTAALLQAARLVHEQQDEHARGQHEQGQRSLNQVDHVEEPTGQTGITPLRDKRVVLLGAGSMGALAGASLRKLDPTGWVDIVVVNRSPGRAQRLATALTGRAAPLESLASEIARADVLISSTGATGLVLGTDDIGERNGRPLIVLDLAMPRDVDPAVAALPGVHYIDLEALRTSGAMVSDAEVKAAVHVVGQELSEFLSAQHQLAVAPTVTALRLQAKEVVNAELARLDARLPDLDATVRIEVANAVRRAVDKILHAPTVRVKELASTPEGDSYAAALRILFDIDPAAVTSVAAVRNSTIREPGSPGVAAS